MVVTAARISGALRHFDKCLKSKKPRVAEEEL
jgi:hypothetical protein